MADVSTHCPAVLAVELAAPARGVLRLPTEQAVFLLDAIAADLMRLVPDATGLGFAASAALYDPAQVLRPGWPLFAELAELHARRHRAGEAPVLAAFGTAAGRMATPRLEPEAALTGGALQVLPFVLAGDAALAQRCGARLEQVLEAEGLAGAAVALFLKQALDIDVVHARYLTHHDLAAMVSIQLGHTALAPAWPLIEAALFTPERDEFARAQSGQPWRSRDGVATALVLDEASWARGPGAGLTGNDRRDAWRAWQWHERAFVAVLGAHGLRIARARAIDWPGADDAMPAAFASAVADPENETGGPGPPA